MTEFVEVKTSDLTGAALDWAVAKAEGLPALIYPSEPPYIYIDLPGRGCGPYHPSHNWSQGGPLIESEELTVEPSAWDWNGACVLWRAHQEGESAYFEHTNLLVAAMRAIAHAKLGDTVSVPKELLS
ncbi:hypothetical protein QIT80_gp47 (endogenous virus) [Pseudomonas phage phiAH14a]|uniref:DUF2591 domain-containing protein n=1 Tax=Pseudomonas phage phiAH14a TaxID=1805958 RepID=A0A1B0VMD7_9CAUD|nr:MULTISPECIES: phage protein NinX family protein [unclassified Pseudomonas]YP_010773064.1 hypothetical protein QIT80_gp47 [Pseudomonas phage phiAH14a]AMW64507.1 hypothetical protein AH14a_p47 [Pseudomonas phage phiAH14a]KAA0946669.1 DUF2591 domain-containing protein [Pseudomonas sp. ANT_H4]KAA0953230.1 DUF2591 domain-containing protein [Pseudomonas sp. ANT_H14]